MNQVTWDQKSFYADGKSVFLVSGEFHYFRVPKEDWRGRLQLLKEAGGNAVATYIPWILHEPAEGQILFGDTAQRDLEGFLALCREMELAVMCRPGPYQYSEMRYDGLPGWLCENYPRIRAENIKGEQFRAASVSYLHPVFLEKVKNWYDAVCPIIAKHMVSRGGAVHFVQFDNEMMGVHVWFGGGWDYNRETMGIGSPGGRYPEYLRQRYGSMEALNTAYQSRYTEFRDVLPLDGKGAGTVGERRNARDYQEFYFFTGLEYAKILIAWMREKGIDCPIVHNSPNPSSNALFYEFTRELGKDFLLGSDHYYTLGPGWPQNNPTPQYVSKVFYSNEMLRLMGYPPTVMELPGGSASDWPPFNAEDVRCCYLANLAFGMKGLNYYIFTGGPNPEGIGRLSDIYDYGAGIGAFGEIRPVYGVQKEFGEFLNRNEWLADAELVQDFDLGLDFEYSRSYSYFEKGDGELAFSNVQAWEFLREGVMISSLCASLMPRMVDLGDAGFAENVEKPLVVAASVCMAADTQKRLVRFVKNGGKLLLLPVIPFLDDTFHPCTILKDFLGGAEWEPLSENFPRIRVGGVENVYMNGKVFKVKKRPAEAVPLAWDEYSQQEIGWEMRCEGGGSVIWLGFSWEHSMFTHLETMRYLLCERLGVQSQVLCSNPNIWAVRRSDGKRHMLFVMNLFSSPLAARIQYRNARGGCSDLGILKLDPMEVKCLPIEP